LTFEDFCALAPDGQKADLLDGVLSMASADNTEAGRLNGWLYTVLNGFVAHRGLGEVYTSGIAFRLCGRPGAGTGHRISTQGGGRPPVAGFIEGPPVLAVEIGSPDSVSRDYVHKHRVYDTAGVREYWSLNPDERKATFLVLVKGRFQEHKPVRHIWNSRAIPGLELDVRWVLGRGTAQSVRRSQRAAGQVLTGGPRRRPERNKGAQQRSPGRPGFTCARSGGC
jgi:Uma2 family endonuclease